MSTSRVSDNNTISKIKQTSNTVFLMIMVQCIKNLKLLAAVEIFDVFSSRQFKDVWQIIRPVAAECIVGLSFVCLCVSGARRRDRQQWVPWPESESIHTHTSLTAGADAALISLFTRSVLDSSSSLMFRRTVFLKTAIFQYGSKAWSDPKIVTQG